ncbi:MAG: hypothetical protein R3B09_02720 [Nannocystaceae bacterium]
MRLRRQIALLVERAGEPRLAHWIEYEHGEGTRARVAVYDHAPTLIPRGKVSLRLEAERYDVDPAAARRWLEGEGYRIRGEVEGAWSG